MKVLVLTTTFPRYKNDTTPSFVFELSKEIKNKGFEVIVLAPHHKNSKFFEELDGVKVYRFPYFFPLNLQKLCYDGGIMRNIRKSFLAKLQVPLFFISYFYFTYRLIKKLKINIIHSHWIIPSGLIGSFFKKFLKVKHITTAHAIDVYTIEKLPFRKILAEFIYNNSDYIICVSNILREKILKILNKKGASEKEKIFVKPMGMKIPFVKDKKIKKEKFNILFLGRFVEKKGIKYLLYALQKVINVHKNVTLNLGGTGPLEIELKNLVKELNLENYVNFLGWVERERIPEILSESDLLVVPSIITEEGDTEGLPTVILEAMGAGVPVIASDVGGIRDVIENSVNGLIVPPGDVESLKKAIITIIENEKLREKFIKEGINLAQNYDWEKIGNFYVSLFKS
ncbi:MAG: glycosyltransferase family 4 protein [candidate division WOR-3 bacterium]